MRWALTALIALVGGVIAALAADYWMRQREAQRIAEWATDWDLPGSQWTYDNTTTGYDNVAWIVHNTTLN